MRHLYRQLNGRGLELSPGVAIWILILLTISAGTSAFITLYLGRTVSDTGIFIIEDIAVITNILLGIFFSAIFADEISTEVSKGTAKNCDMPFGMLNYLWSRLLNSVINVVPFYIYSAVVFLFAYRLGTGEFFSIRFTHILISSALAILPLMGMSSAVAIWFKNKFLLSITLGILYTLSLLGTDTVPKLFRAVLPDLDLYQTDIRLFYGANGSWLYLFSLLGIAFVWSLSATSLSSMIYNFSKGFKKYPYDHRGFKVFLYKSAIVLLSMLFALHIYVELKKIEVFETEFIDGYPIIPKTGWKGLNSILINFYLKEKIADSNLSSEEIKSFRKLFALAASQKPSYKILQEGAYFMFTSVPVTSEDSKQELKKLCNITLENYLKNNYIAKSAEFELVLASSLINPFNPYRDEYMTLAINLLRSAAEKANGEISDMISKRLVSLNAEIIEKTAWKQAMMPINRDYAELLVWYREWKRAMTFKNYKPINELHQIEKNIILTAERAEKNSNGNPNLLSSIEKIRRNLYLAKYIRNDRALNF